jgi:S-adenosylmethionine/arginine decarboxylase-like enzyme|tara:strand:+ start:4207 stop:4653 length:447 start_codon:yes stop_codon:yes gene_type:complete
MNPNIVHKHLLVRAQVNSPPLYNYSSDRLNLEIKSLIKAIDMNILSGPHTAYSNVVGNEGWSSTAIIDTSSITFHSWIDTSIIQLDVYSCKEFKIKDVFTWLAQFDIEQLDYKYLDREQGFKTLADNELSWWDNKQYNASWEDEVAYE